LEQEADYDPGNKAMAFDKAQEWGERIPIGVVYKRESPTFEEQLSALKKGALVKQKIEPSRIERLLDEFL
jgi:2-oxoglutarate ferredoxin oxidoreductase subunit beta